MWRIIIQSWVRVCQFLPHSNDQRSVTWPPLDVRGLKIMVSGRAATHSHKSTLSEGHKHLIESQPSQQPYKAGAIIIPILQIKKLRNRRFNEFA